MRLWNFFEKRGRGEGGSDFSYKKGAVGKIGGKVVLKKGVSLIFVLSNPYQCYLPLGVWYVCVLFIYTTISTSIICISKKNLNFIASNQQTCDFYKWVILKRKGIVVSKVQFWYQWIIQCNMDSCCENITGGVTIYLHGCQSIGPCVCSVSVCVCVCMRLWYQMRVPANYRCQIAVNLMPYCIKHTARFKVWHM